MCKIMVMSGINEHNRKLAWEFTKLMAVQMSPGNSDGLGYSAVTTDGELFGERWHNNTEAFSVRHVNDPSSTEELDMLKAYGGSLVSEEKPIRYNRYGVINEDSVAAITLHTRLATSGKQFVNTHPFVRDGVSLIHNGVISNAYELEVIQSTCDSEAILNLYIQHNVRDNPQQIQKVASKLDGYYACGVIAETKKYGYVVDIFKDSRARLSAAYIRDMNIVVFATSIDDIVAVAQQMGMEIGYKYKVKEGKLLRLSTLTGAPLLVQTFKDEFKERKTKFSKPNSTNEWKSTVSVDNPMYDDRYVSMTDRFNQGWKR